MVGEDDGKLPEYIRFLIARSVSRIMASLTLLEEMARQVLASEKPVLSHFIALMQVSWSNVLSMDKAEILLNGFKTLRQLTADPDHATQIYQKK